jgi:ketosteroid isomerase-like protein
MQNTTLNPKTLVAQYIEAVGAKDYDAVSRYLSPDLSFKGPFMQSESADAFIASLKRMAPIWEANRIREVFAEGDRACVIYDFVSNTEAGAMPCIELLTFRDDRIASIELFFDRAQFAPAAQALAQKAPK